MPDDEKYARVRKLAEQLKSSDPTKSLEGVMAFAVLHLLDELSHERAHNAGGGAWPAFADLPKEGPGTGLGNSPRLSPHGTAVVLSPADYERARKALARPTPAAPEGLALLREARGCIAGLEVGTRPLFSSRAPWIAGLLDRIDAALTHPKLQAPAAEVKP